MHPVTALCVLISAAAFAGGALAQTVIDDSALRFPPNDIKVALQLIGSKLRDPISSQIRGLKRTDQGYYCGWVNAKTGRGGYAGFRAFVITTEPTLVSFIAPGNEGQFERGAFIITMQGPGKNCAED